MKKLVLTGATGNIGQELVPLLLENDVQLTMIVRDAKEVQPHEKVTIVQADLKDRNSYADALGDVDAVFLLTSGSLQMDELQMGFIDTCVEQGVPFLIKQSGMGAAPDSPAKMLSFHYAIGEHLKASGIPYCILQPNSYTQNLLAHTRSVKEQGAIYAPMGDGKVSYIDVRDIARVAATVLMHPEDHKNQTYVLTGPSAVSMNEVADLIGSLVDKNVQYYPVSYEQGKEAMLGFGIEEWLVSDLIAIAKIGAEEKAAMVSEDVEKVTSQPPRSVKRSLEDFKNYFT